MGSSRHAVSDREEVSSETDRIIVKLSNYLQQHEIAFFEGECSEFSSRKSTWFNFPVGSSRRSYLNAYVRYAVFSEIYDCLREKEPLSFRESLDVAKSAFVESMLMIRHNLGICGRRGRYSC